MDVTKGELTCLFVFAVFIVCWSFILVPNFQTAVQQLAEPNPLIFYPLFNMVYILLFSFLTYLLLKVLGARKSLAKLATSSFRYGLAGFILLWMIPDLIAPPYLVTMTGELLTSHPLWPAVSDSFWYTVLQPYVPPEMMYLTIYCAVPVSMFFTVLLIVSPRRLAKIVKEL